MKTAAAPLVAAQAVAPGQALPQADHRPTTVAQRQLLAAIDNSPRQLAQRQALATNGGSPQPRLAGSSNEPVAQLAGNKGQFPGMQPPAKKRRLVVKPDPDDGYEPDTEAEQSSAPIPMPLSHLGASSTAPTGQALQDDEPDDDDMADVPMPLLAALASHAPASSAATSEEMPQALGQTAPPVVLHMPPTLAPVSPAPGPEVAVAASALATSPSGPSAQAGELAQAVSDDKEAVALGLGAATADNSVATSSSSLPDGLAYSDIDDEDATGMSAQQHHQDRVHKMQIKELGRQIHDDSSESEADATYLPNRQRKAAMLAAIAAGSLNLTPEQREQRATILAKRKAAYKNRPDKLHKYDKAEQAQFMQLGNQLKAHSLYHNDYLRRAMGKSVSKEQVQEGGSQAYTNRQGVIREQLLKVLRKDHKKMEWKREDFADDETWGILQYLFDKKMSGASAKDKKTTPLSEAVKQGVDMSTAENLNSATEFHHLAFKESMGGTFEHLALNPVNLVAVHGRRSEKATPDAAYGMHQLAHDVTGYDASEEFSERAGRAKAKNGKKAGGVFSDIDTEALYYVLKTLVTPRASKTATHKPEPAPAPPTQD
jgi:hypothetical protein